MASVALALGLLASGTGTAVAASEGPVVVPGEPTFAANGEFSPKALSKSTPTPVSLALSAEIRSLSGAPPSALARLEADLGEAVVFDFDGIPGCPAGGAEDTKTFERRCKRSLIGTGQLTVRPLVAPPPKSGPAPLLPGAIVYLRNTGPHGATLGVHEYEGPAVGVLDLPIHVRENPWWYGPKRLVLEPQPSTFDTPLAKLNLTINKKFTTKGRKSSVISATCQEGQLAVATTATFANGERRSGDLVRTCTPKP